MITLPSARNAILRDILSLTKKPKSVNVKLSISNKAHSANLVQPLMLTVSIVIRRNASPVNRVMPTIQKTNNASFVQIYSLIASHAQFRNVPHVRKVLISMKRKEHALVPVAKKLMVVNVLRKAD